MGRSAEPRSWRQAAPLPDCLEPPAEESDPIASTSSSRTPLSSQAGADRQNSTRPVQRLVPLPLDSWLVRDDTAPASSSTAVTEHLRRSVLPASTPNDDTTERTAEAVWRNSTSTPTTFGGLSPESDPSGSANIDLTNIRISRSARASWNAAFNDTQDFPSSSTMLPPRLGTPVPAATGSSSSSSSAPAELTQVDSEATLPPFSSERALEEGLTSTGRRALARHRLRMLEGERRNIIADAVMSPDGRTLENARAAVEASRIALEQARLAIRMALRDSESRLGRLADSIRRQLQSESGDMTLTVPSRSEAVEDEAERSEYNLEQSLRALRTASLEIDRVLASSRSSASGVLEVAGHSASSALTASRQVSSSATSTGSSGSLPQAEASASEMHPQASRLTSATSLLDPGVAESSDSILRQPTPRRPVRYLRGSPIPSLSNLRSRIASQEAGSNRSNRPQRSPPNRSLAVQVSLVGYANDSTSNLARNVLTNLSQRASVLQEETPLLGHDEHAAEQSMPHSRPTGYRQLGRWIRLDANGDEITGSRDDNRAPLGWTWAVVPSSLTAEEEKSPSLPTLVPSVHGSIAEDTATSLLAANRRGYDVVGR